MATAETQPTAEFPRPEDHRASLGVVALELFLPVLAAGLVLIGAVTLAALIYRSVFTDRIYLGVSTMGIDLGGYITEEGIAIVQSRFADYLRQPVTLRAGGRRWQATPQQLGLSVSAEATVAQAFTLGRTGTLREQLFAPFFLWRDGSSVTEPVLQTDSGAIKRLLDQIAREIEEPALDAKLSLKPGQKIVVVADKPGQRLDSEQSAGRIASSLLAMSTAPIELVIVNVEPVMSATLLEEARSQASTMLSGPIVLKHQDKTWTWQRESIAGFLRINEQTAGDSQKSIKVTIDDAGIASALEPLRKELMVEAKNARFDFANRQMVPIYPGRQGSTLDIGAAVPLIRDALLREQGREVVLPVKSVKPAIAAEDGPRLGIRELIQEASTVYGGTLPDRMYNVELASQRLHGVVIPPDQEFSFNKEVGEVSYRSGYKKGYGITQTEGEVLTIPSEGGGICQVATTLFQSVFWAGLPVLERNWHLYWIPRYGQKPTGLTGLDATVDQVFDKNYNLIYEVDFRFKNTTGQYLLIQTETDKKNVYFRLYGKKPDWQVKVEEPVVDQVVKANPTPVRQPDLTLKPGEQIVLEVPNDGFRVRLRRVVTSADKVIQEQMFESVYKPSRNYTIYGPTPTPVGTPLLGTPGPGTPAPGAATQDRPAGTPKPVVTPVATPQATPAPPPR